MPSYENAENKLTAEREKHLDRMISIGIEAFEQAVKESDAISEPRVPLKGNLTNLGSRINARYKALYEKSEKPDEAALFAKKWLWIAARHSQLTWYGWIAEKLCADDEDTQCYAKTFEAGYADLGDAFSNHLAETKYGDAIKLQKPNWQWYDPLEAIALVWFCEADTLIASGDATGALEKIADAFSAIESSHGFFMWDEGAKCNEEDNASSVDKLPVSKLASLLAKKRHSENYALIEDAVSYWRKNVDPNLSAQQAASALLGVVPLSHKKLAEIVSAEKKKA